METRRGLAPRPSAMSKLPAPQHSTAAAIYAWWEKTIDNSPRAHLGASELGHACERYLWLSFRWAERPEFDGRLLRRFNRGKREEAVIIEELRGIGCEVHADDGGEQFRAHAVAGHVGGSMDAVLRGLPEAPASWHVGEFKTHNAKSFKDLQAKGVAESKPQHWAQMQVYMHMNEIDRALYVAVCKDTDELHIERLHRDKDAGARLMAKAERIVRATTPPARMSEDPAWYQCKWCRFHGQCHGTDAPRVNCRTCVHATPVADGEALPDGTGRWSCARHKHRAMSVAVQAGGCPDHRVIPVLLERFAEPVDADLRANTVSYRNKLTGAEFVNGNAADEVTSVELRDLQDKATLGAERVPGLVSDLRQQMGGRYAG